MTVGVNLISGCMVGIEFVNDEDLGMCVAIDLLIVRIVLFWDNAE